jgi:D-beta-D-heptose 7-phosphate kinase/D-beta-D-heptose 1-phosphate adenosyltransferase
VASLLEEQRVHCDGLLQHFDRATSIKTRIIAHQQQVVRMDRETRTALDDNATQRLMEIVAQKLPSADAVIVGDYGKGVVTQPLLDQVKRLSRARGIWVSLDPKPVHPLDLSHLSLITPNRKEAFELAGVNDGLTRIANPLNDAGLLNVAEKLLRELQPALLLITLGDQGLLLCQRGQKPFHIPTLAREVFDVSGAGDTVIASFTLAIAAGASPLEAAVFSNHAAGGVVGKVGTATVAPEELLASFQREKG